MRNREGVSTRDAAALLEIVHDGISASGSGPFPRDALWALACLIPSDAFVGYQEADLTGRLRVVEIVEVVGEPPSRSIEEAYWALGSQNPLRCRVRKREKRVLRLSDLVSVRQRRRLDYYAEVWRPVGVEDALRLWLPAPRDRARSVYLERSGRKYTDREKRLFALLRPHFARIRQGRELRRRAHGLPELTEREGEVLGWVAEGKTNREIARLLFLSPHTVRKHLENAFDKLGVHTRTAAAAHFTRNAATRT